MPQNEQNSPPVELVETGFEDLQVHEPAAEVNIDYPAGTTDPLANDRANRIAAIRAEAAAREAEEVAKGVRRPQLPEPSAALLAAAEEQAGAEMRAASAFKVSSNPNEVLPTREELLARQQAQAARVQAQMPQPSGPVDVATDARYAGMTWDQVVATRQEEARLRHHQKEMAERESNQVKKEQFKERVLAARRPETTVHRPQPTAPAISAQTLAEMEAGRKRSEEFSHQRGAWQMPRVR